MNENQYEIFAQNIAGYRAEAYKERKWKVDRERELKYELDEAEGNAEYKAIVEKEILNLRANCNSRRDKALIQASAVRKLAKDFGLDMKKLDVLTDDMYYSMRDEKPEVIIIGSKNVF